MYLSAQRIKGPKRKCFVYKNKASLGSEAVTMYKLKCQYSNKQTSQGFGFKYKELVRQAGLSCRPFNDSSR